MEMLAPSLLPLRGSAARLAPSFRTAPQGCQPHPCPRAVWAVGSAFQPREETADLALFDLVQIAGAQPERAQRVAAGGQRAPGIVAAEHQLLRPGELHHRGEAEWVVHAGGVVIELLQ